MVTSSFSTILCCSIGAFLIMVVCIAGCSAQGKKEGDSCQATPDVTGTCRVIAECKEEAEEIIRKGGRPALCGLKGIQPIICCTQSDGNGPSDKIKAIGESCQATPDVMGTCRMIAECEEAKELIRKGGRPALCGLKGTQPIVCCTQITAVGEKAKKHCEEYKKLCPSSSGTSRHLLQKRTDEEVPGLLVAGGEPAERDEFPHMAAIGYGEDKEVVWGCGGALISENYVLTAAHCLWDAKRGPALLVRLGAEVVEDTLRGSSLNAAKGQTHKVLERIRHPGYNRPEKYNDVALLKIDGSTIQGANAGNGRSWTIRPACLHYEGDFELINGKAIATGWGRLGFGEDVTSELQKVSLSVLDNSVCNKTFDVEIRTTSQLPRGIDSSCICAGELGGGKDTCVGDSGGPLQLANHGGTCVTQLIGITSFGKFCGFENSPAVYMRVMHYVSWIESVVWP